MSLGFRLLLLGGIFTSAAVLFTWLVIGQLFEAFFVDRVRQEMHQLLDSLTANTEINDQGHLQVSRMPDSRFQIAESGLYWQVQESKTPLATSTSLWDRSLPVESGGNPGVVNEQIIWSDNEEIMLLSWVIDIDKEVFPNGVILSVATALLPVRAAADTFQREMALWMALLAAALIIAGWFQVRIGLRPLDTLRAEVAVLRSDTAARIKNPYPAEIVPLVDEVNMLLDFQQEAIEHAQNRTADLAHGLKTPLTVIEALAAEAETKGLQKTADELKEQVWAAGSFVERELVRTKRRTGKRVNSPLAESARKMVAAISKLPSDRKIEWIIDVQDSMLIPMDKSDVSELLGNLLDNARKYANSRIALSANCDNGKCWMKIEDDGPGVPENELDRISTRGEQFSNGNKGGFGLGLTIASDLAEEHGCTFQVTNKHGGGLQCLLTWKA